MREGRQGHDAYGSLLRTAPGAAALLIGGVTVALLRFGRGFFWPHAVLSGLAVAALAYSGWRTWTTMRARRPSTPRHGAPREHGHSRDEQHVDRAGQVDAQKEKLDPGRQSQKRQEESSRHDPKG